MNLLVNPDRRYQGSLPKEAILLESFYLALLTMSSELYLIYPLELV